VTLDDGTQVAFTDPRRLARVRLLTGLDPLVQPPLSELGPDALNQPLTLPAFGALLRSRTLPIKALLLDQAIISGIGNWVADEVLYQAAVHPEARCCALDVPAIRRLHAAVSTVLNCAVAVEADSARFPRDWLFHYRWVKKAAGSKDGAGRSISFVTVGGRTSAVVAAVQGASGRQLPADDDVADLVEDGGDGGGGGGAGGAGSKRKRPRKSSPSPAGAARGTKRSRGTGDSGGAVEEGEGEGEGEAATRDESAAEGTDDAGAASGSAGLGARKRGGRRR